MIQTAYNGTRLCAKCKQYKAIRGGKIRGALRQFNCAECVA